MRESSRRSEPEVLLPPVRERRRVLKRAKAAGGYSLQFTEAAQAQLQELPFEGISQVEKGLERICRDQDPLHTGCPTDLPSRRRYQVDQVYVVAWVTRVDPVVRLLTVVEIISPDKTSTPSKPAPLAPLPEGKAPVPLGKALVPVNA